MLSITPHAHVEEFNSISLDFQTVVFNPIIHFVSINMDTTKISGVFTMGAINIEDNSVTSPIGIGLTIFNRVT
mgnify:CR=1 FL=1